MPTSDPGPAWAGQWGLFLAATQTLTRIPVQAPHGPGVLRAASRYFPAVGVLVGLVAALVFEAARNGLPAPIASVLSLAASLLLTGALHEDGLADCCDGLFGGRTRDRALEIMRDSRVGAFGVLGVFTVLSGKVLLVAAVPDAIAALVAGHAVGRFWAVACSAALPYARPEGMAGDVAGPGWLEIGVAGTVALGAALLLGPRTGAALMLSGAVALGFGWWARRRLGGYTGDVLGAMTVLTEVAVLLAATWRAA